jgi:signal transduction histidine kinase
VAEQHRLVPTRTIQFTPLWNEAIPLFIDADRIGQVVTNFLTNAIKYSEDEAPIVVQIEHDASGTRVGVTDQGPGLSESQRQHLWEKFYRVPGVEVQSGSGVGLGLGLYICRTIIAHHGGQVGVDSQIGVGSTFWFTLPATTEEEPA